MPQAKQSLTEEQKAFELAVLREIEDQYGILMAIQCREASGGRYLGHCNHPDLTTCGKCQKVKIRRKAEANVRGRGR